MPLLGLENEFPDKVHVLFHPASKRYGCYCHDGVHGLACFSNESGAFRFAEHIDHLTGMAVLEVDFEEAREIAKNRPMPIISLMLLDNLSQPQIHFVR
jgi:hypothetical protein